MNLARVEIVLVGITLTAMPSVASACGLCAFALADRYLPLVYVWCFAISALFVATSVAVRYSHGAINFPSPLISFGIVIGAFFIGIGMWGPLPFILPAAGAGFGVWHLIRHRDYSSNPALRIGGIAFVLSFGVLATLSFLKGTRRSDADYLIEWKAKAGSRRILEQMAKRGPSGLDEIRRVVREGDMGLVGMAAETLAASGDPSKDVPLLIGALKRVRELERPMGGHAGSEVEKSLRRLTGFSLPENTKAEKWETAWSARK